MPESTSHIRLVNALVEWVTKIFLGGDHARVLVDGSCFSAKAKPKPIFNFVPDMYVQLSSGVFVIGEAKTVNDIENLHTYEQFTSFMRWVDANPGSLLAVAVPWHKTRLARSILADISAKNFFSNAKFLILERLAG